MSQPTTQSSLRNESVTADNTANNSRINATHSKPPASGVDTGSGTGTGGGPEDEIKPEEAQKEGLPEQKHAGAVGYGPEYASKNRATLGEKITGIKEELVGKVTKKPDLVERGHERLTGELKRKEHAGGDIDPFANPQEKAPAGSTPNVNNDTTTNSRTNSGPGLGGGKSTEVDTAAGESRLTTDPSHPAAQDEGAKRAAAI